MEKAISQVAPMSLHSHGEKTKKIHMGKDRGRTLPLQHLHGKILESMFEPSFIDYAFMIVRDPVSRMVSEYRHSRGLDRIETRFGFSRWLRFSMKMKDLMPGFRNNHFRAQSDYICFNAKILRFEDGIEEALGRVSTDVGFTLLDVPHKRKSEQYAVAVSDADRALIQAAYAADYERLGYGKV